MPTLTFVNPSKAIVWKKLKSRVLKVYPEAEVHIEEGKDKRTKKKTIWTKIRVWNGGDKHSPSIEKVVDITATKEAITVEVVTTDNRKSHDRSTKGTITIFQERSATNKYIGVNVDTVSSYIDRSIDFFTVVTYNGYKDKLSGFIND